MVGIYKKALRVLGIAESYVRGKSRESLLAGVVMRGDFIIDGFAFTKITVGGMDATEGVLRIYKLLNREDISIIMLNGCIIAWFNIIDIDRVYEETGRPVIVVTYEESEGIEDFIKRYFPEDAEERIRMYRKLGSRQFFRLKTGYTVYIRTQGITYRDACVILNRFTVTGSVPEPLRVARLLARQINKNILARNY